MTEIPYFAIGNDELKDKPEATGSKKCNACKKLHKIEYGTTDGVENKILGYVKCGENLYLATINNKIV